MEILLIVLLTLILSAFFSGIEIAYVSASKLDIELRRNDGSARGKLLAHLYDNPARFLASNLIGNSIVVVIFTYFMTRVLSEYTDTFIGQEFLSGLLNTIIIAFILLFFAEFIPKVIFRYFGNDILYASVYLIYVFNWLLIIPTKIMSWLSEMILKYVFRIKPGKNDTNITRLDLEHYVQVKTDESNDEIETEIFKNALHLRQVKVRDCMVPRTEIEYIEVDSDLKEFRERIVETKHSRLIVIDEDIDNVLGYIHHLALIKSPQNIQSELMNLPTVPEAMGVHDLMLQFIRDRVNIAIVVDEYGSTTGLITLEDILEEIFGEIEDEHDEESFTHFKNGHGEYVFSGRIELSQIQENYPELTFPDGDFQTLSGYIVNTMESIPEEHEKVTIDNYEIFIQKVSDTKVDLVTLKIIEED